MQLCVYCTVIEITNLAQKCLAVQPNSSWCRKTKAILAKIGIFAETAIIHYRSSFADQGKQTFVSWFPFAANKRNFIIRFLFAASKLESPCSVTSVFRLRMKSPSLQNVSSMKCSVYVVYSILPNMEYPVLQKYLKSFLLSMEYPVLLFSEYLISCPVIRYMDCPIFCRVNSDKRILLYLEI